jgi:methionyl-tRNA formyltransferase
MTQTQRSRIAFFGTPELAAEQLRALLAPDVATKHEVVLVVAQPDRPSGRGHKLQPPPVKEVALEHGIAVAQPTTLKKDTPDGDAFFAQLTALDLDLAIVAAYGRILPQRILSAPKREMVNVHASLLPRWRGAAPIQRAIEAGDTKTGVCLMHMVKELDAGDVYARGEVDITPFDDGETLTKKVAQCGAQLLAKHIDALVAGTLARTPQPSEGVTYAHQLAKTDGLVVWTKPARAVTDHARAMHPWPGAHTTLPNGDVLKLFAPRRLNPSGRASAPGTVVGLNDGIVIACGANGDEQVAFTDAQVPGKKRVPAETLVHGRVLAIGDVLGAGGSA